MSGQNGNKNGNGKLTRSLQQTSSRLKQGMAGGTVLDGGG